MRYKHDPRPNTQAEDRSASRREPYLLQYPADRPLPKGQRTRPGADRAVGVSGGQALRGVLPSLHPAIAPCKGTGGPVWPRRPRGGIGMAPERNWALSAESSGASLLCHRSRKSPLTIVSKAIRGRSGIYHRAGRPLLMKSPKALPSKVWQSCRTFPTRDGGNENVRRSER